MDWKKLDGWDGGYWNETEKDGFIVWLRDCKEDGYVLVDCKRLGYIKWTKNR